MENELCTYDMACMRAELLGQEAPDKEEFEKKLEEQLKVQQNDLEIEESKILEAESDNINRTHGKLDELNTILSATQKKLSNFKRTACGSLSNIFKGQSIDKVETDANYENINLENNEMPSNSGIVTKDSTVVNNVNPSRNESLDIDKKFNSHLDKLDSLINKAENAEMSMASQTQQMKKFMK